MYSLSNLRRAISLSRQGRHCHFSSSFPSSTATTTSDVFLFRDFIHESLYHDTHGYFSSTTPPILSTTSTTKTTTKESQSDLQSESILLKLRNRHEYQAAVSNMYKTHQHGWLTPVQLFTPYLSRAIANRIITSSDRDHAKIHIIEIGPGVGTLARDILMFLQSYHPHILSRLQYSLVEISPVLSQFQTRALQPWIKTGVVVPILADARTWMNQFSKYHKSNHNDVNDNTHVHVVATEVLDNLPHDLVRMRNENKQDHEQQQQQQQIVQQALIHYTGDDIHDRSSRTLFWDQDHSIDEDTLNAMHAFKLYNDNLSSSPIEASSFSSDLSTPQSNSFNFTNFLRDTMDSIISMQDSRHHQGISGGGGKEIWVPTGCYQLLKNIIAHYPTASFTITDFTQFPGTLPGLLAPVVQRVCKGMAFVYDSVHEAPFGQVDIMFPTDFQRVAHAHSFLLSSSLSDTQQNVTMTTKKTKVTTLVKTQKEFFEQYAVGDDLKTTTLVHDGFNPVLDDFENVSFLLIDVQR